MENTITCIRKYAGQDTKDLDPQEIFHEICEAFFKDMGKVPTTQFLMPMLTAAIIVCGKICFESMDALQGTLTMILTKSVHGSIEKRNMGGENE